MSDRLGTLSKQINYISPTYSRPTKEMLEKYENIWLPLRKKIKDKKKQSKKIFLLYGDFDIIEIKENITNPKSNDKSSKKKSNSSTRKKQREDVNSKKQIEVVKGKNRTWSIRDK